MSNIRVTHSASPDNARAESAVIVNPNNPQQVVAASKMFNGLHDYQFVLATAYSIDGGHNWNESQALKLPLDASGITDPALAWDDSNNVFLLGLALKNLPKGDDVGITVYKSTDGGQTWGDPYVIHSGASDDKCWLVGDTNLNSPHHGNLYAVWDSAGGLGYARSLDHGDSWESIAGGTIDGTTIWPNSHDPEINIAADGNVYVVFRVVEFVLLVSDNGGDSFTLMPDAPTNTVVEIDPFNGTPSAGGGWAVLPGGNFRVITAPSACVVDQTVVIAWADWRDGKARIYYALSHDGGASWITDPAGQPLLTGSIPDNFHHVFPQVIADPSGVIACSYYEFGPKPQDNLIDVFVARSLDGGLTFLPFKVTDQPWDPTINAPWAHWRNDFSKIDASCTFIGDYFGLDASYGGFYPCWTDTRDGQEELYTDIVPVPRCAFLIERSTLGQDEIDARRNLPGGPVVPDAFHVIVDGLTASELGVTNSSTKLNVVSPINGMTINCTGNKSATGSYGSEIQRFTFNYDLDFGQTDDAFNFPNPTKPIILNVTTHGLSAAGEIELIKQPNPFILDGDPPWLSVDLRVLSIAEDETRFGLSCPDATSAPLYIQTLIAALKNGKGVAGGEHFATLDDQLFVFPTHKKKRVFNFAIARVHYIGTIGAQSVRVFFRLFPALTTSTGFDLSHNYRRRDADAGHPDPIPRAGIHGTEYTTIPCFANNRIDSTVETMDDQIDFPFNVQDIGADPQGKEVFHFFGCWLDINQPYKPDGVTPNNVLPVNVDAKKDGPFQDPANPPLPIQKAILRNSHQCLIAEISFDPISIPGGKDPFNSDKLAQRNLAWGDLANPGVDGSRRAINNFEIRPTPQTLPPHETPDELMIEWGNVPAGTTAQIYLPAVDVDDVLRTADGMYTTHSLARVDSHTIECAADGIVYIPVPRGPELNFAGLLSLDFPAGIMRGQHFNVVVKQLTSAFGTTNTPPPGAPSHAAAVVKKYPIKWRRVLGAFQVNIPVQTKSLLLPREERLLSVMRWIGEAISADSRWYPVFRRYLDQLSDRVAGFGGNPDDVLPSPDGDGRRSKCDHRLKWLVPAILAPMMVLIALAPLFWSAPLAALAIVLLLACSIYWRRLCKISDCDLLSALILGFAVAYFVIGLVFLMGLRRFGLVAWLALLGVINGVLILIATIKQCGRCCDEE
jgi:hypothetical protein